MNVHKHMEAIFMIAAAVVGLGSYVLDSLNEADAKPAVPIARSIGTPTQMAVVVVSAQRTAARS